MRGRKADESDLADFVSARTGELHRAAYLLTADQDRAERLVAAAVDRLRRDRTPLGQAGGAARHHMARLAAAATEPSETTNGGVSSPAERQRAALAGMSPRQRAVLMLRSLERYDERSTARALGISRRAVRAAECAAEGSLGISVDSDECRSALTDFAERATWPDSAVTIAAAAQVTLPRRHSRGRYVAVAVVLAVGAAAPIASQVQHNHWLRTPEGINTPHGTHFHAYTQGFKLVGVQRVPVGTTRTVVSTSADEAMTLGCEHFSARKIATWPKIDSGEGWESFPCAAGSAKRYFFDAAAGKKVVKAPTSGHQDITVARYKKVPWDSYPVAKSQFEVERDKTIGWVAHFDGSPTSAGKTLTLRGTNGTYTGEARVPAAAKHTELVMSALLSPTTTGWYKIQVNGEVLSNCSPIAPGNGPDSGWCRLYDDYIPQLTWGAGGPGMSASSGSIVVKIEVRHALGPWKLQVRYDRYRSGQ